MDRSVLQCICVVMSILLMPVPVQLQRECEPFLSQALVDAPVSRSG